MLLFYIIWKNYNEIQLIKNKMDLKNRKMKNPPPSPGTIEIKNKCTPVPFTCSN